MKLVVMIPAHNEEETIGGVIREVPRTFSGVDAVEVLVIADGCRDGTVRAAREAGADSIVEFRQNRGLAKVFQRGLEEATKRGADVIVNIDADGQYDTAEMEKLIAPVLSGEADMVLGSRFLGHIESMPQSKKLGNRLGSWVTSFLAGRAVSDAATGYRALSREAALSLNVLSHYTYTQETIIQAAYKRLKVVEVPILFRKRAAGESRLVTSFLRYASNAAATVIRTFLFYRALGVLSVIGLLLIAVGLGLGIRVLAHFLTTGFVSPFIPSAIAAGFFVLFGFQVIVLGLVADMIRGNRVLIESLLFWERDRSTTGGRSETATTSERGVDD